MYLFCTCTVYFVHSNVLFFCPYFNWMIDLFFTVEISYILDVSHLSDLWLANIFSFELIFLSSWQFFVEKKILFFMKSNQFFLLCSMCLVSSLRTLYLVLDSSDFSPTGFLFHLCQKSYLFPWVYFQFCTGLFCPIDLYVHPSTNTMVLMAIVLKSGRQIPPTMYFFS